MNITVATTEATIVNNAVTKVRMRKGTDRRSTKVRRRCTGWLWFRAGSPERDWGGREETANGDRKMRTKVRTVAVMKRPNIQWDATLAIASASVMSAGRATVDSCQLFSVYTSTPGGDRGRVREHTGSSR